jgi:hypothetical protein
MQPFAHRQALSALFVRPGIMPCTIADDATVNTYDAAPQNAAGIDSWDSGRILPRRILLIVNVASASGTGTLTVTLRDSAAAITTGNGDASTALVVQLTAISEAGQYVAEVDLNHVFPDTTDAQSYIRRYHTLRMVADGCDFVADATMLYCFMDRAKPTQAAEELTVTYNDPS